MLDINLKNQLKQYLDLLENDLVIKVSLDESKKSEEMKEFLDEVVFLTNRISLEDSKLERTPSFSIERKDKPNKIVFAGIPLGHEFTSFVLAILQIGGRAPKISQANIDLIKSIDKNLQFTTFVSLTCHNCPDVVQALNMMSALNPNITHTMVDGAIFKDEADNKEVMAVPAVFLNNEYFDGGRMSLDDILKKLGISKVNYDEKPIYDVLVIGGGPAGASAAIYAARKGIKTGVIAERIGGQVLDTLSIENIIGVRSTTGPKLGQDLEAHMKDYNVDIIKSENVVNLEKKELIEVTLSSGGILKSKTAIIATGSKWRNVNVPGEAKFKNKGVAYCPHCDGPLFEGKDVAVIGGGNSGIEAAIDLAGTSKHVTVLEFLPELKADKVLQEKLYSLSNVTVYKNVQTKEITGVDKVNGITFVNRDNNNETHINLDGVFVQIGLMPSTEWINNIEKNRMGELVIDNRGATSIPGVFAAGDCTNSLYKQIIISMGAGAIAALSAFDYIIRN
ncbi:MAG: alkyl hydroperoxide reductase subunit F [Bacilli bacterium]